MLTRRTLIAGTVVSTAALTGCGVLGIGPRGLLSRDAKPFQFYPAEEYAHVTIETDGSLLVTLDLVFDAGAEENQQPLSGWSPHQINLGQGSEAGTRRVARPEFSELSARAIAPLPGGLPVSTPKQEESGRRWQIGENWAPGRHRVRVTHRVRGVWVDVDGESRLILRTLGLHAPWYATGDTGYTELTVAGRPPVWKVHRREGVLPVDDPDRPRLDGADGDLYLFVRPTDITAAPVPAEVVR
ncbi:hypothetical protein AADG42_12065 [Ammonicoccus fulvus]|uniref:Lipoprotein n=1 Tax=Ammonicoccus fulvus TaxID=3138240 RepID=A0ABZ3FRJ2_9ACTN